MPVARWADGFRPLPPCRTNRLRQLNNADLTIQRLLVSHTHLRLAVLAVAALEFASAGWLLIQIYREETDWSWPHA